MKAWILFAVIMALAGTVQAAAPKVDPASAEPMGIVNSCYKDAHTNSFMWTKNFEIHPSLNLDSATGHVAEWFASWVGYETKGYSHTGVSFSFTDFLDGKRYNLTHCQMTLIDNEGSQIVTIENCSYPANYPLQKSFSCNRPNPRAEGRFVDGYRGGGKTEFGVSGGTGHRPTGAAQDH